MAGGVRFRAIRLSTLANWWSVVVLVLAFVIAHSTFSAPGDAGLFLLAADVDHAAVPVAVPTRPRPVHRAEPIYTMPVDDRLVSFAVNIDWGEEFLPRMLETFAARN